MRFAVDAHAVGRQLTGNEVYVRSLLQAFAELDRDSEFFAYVSAKGAETLIPKRVRVRHVSASPWARLGWDLQRQVRRDRPDLLHVQYTAPLGRTVPVVVTVHDVSFAEHPEYFPLMRRAQLRCTVARTVHMARRILTVSRFSRDAILRLYDIPAGKVRVVPNAAGPDFRVVGREKAITAVSELLHFQAPFVLSVGDLQPRKNQIALIAAFSKLVRERPALKHHLVLTGKETWFAQKVREAAQSSGLADRIHLTGFVSDSHLVQLYNACDCFVFPSYYEGFGLPILEAMACGRAVACSNTSAMPEVAGGAGLLFDPNCIDDIKRCIEDLLVDSELRRRKEHSGIQRAACFSWQKSARATLDVYREVVNERSGSQPALPVKSRALSLSGIGRDMSPLEKP
jgi:glycosyltransferase involved in cell wall biosynthesis